MGKVNLFVYGTLMDKRLLHRLTGKTFPMSPARLKDFKKRRTPSGYPFILPDKGSEIEGLLIRNIDPESLSRLDHYEDEGRLYMREKVTVLCRDRRVACQTYVGNPRLYRPAS